MYKFKNSKTELALACLIGLVFGVAVPFILKQPTQSPAPATTESGYFSPDGNYQDITATKAAATATNYCHDAIKNKEWEGMRLKYPADVGILHLYALRIGLCQAVDDKKIGLETAIDVFDVEHQKLIKERLQQKDPNRQLAI